MVKTLPCDSIASVVDEDGKPLDVWLGHTVLRREFVAEAQARRGNRDQRLEDDGQVKRYAVLVEGREAEETTSDLGVYAAEAEPKETSDEAASDEETTHDSSSARTRWRARKTCRAKTDM